jgi:hypothetical protein
LPEWIIEEGIGETRAALVDNDEILEARVRREGVIAAGAVLDAKLVAVAPRVMVEASGEQFLMPRGITRIAEGAALAIQVMREALGGSEPWKRGLARRTDAAPAPAPPLAEGRAGAIHAWNDLLDEARTGVVRFEGGELRIQPTAAMTIIDVDGWLIPAKLAQMAAWAAARAIARFDIGGSIGVDFPTLKGRDERREVDEILDAYLPKPFEKTAINGFGFVQIVRPKPRPSLLELAQDRGPFEARSLLRRAGGSIGPTTITAHPAVIAAISEDWRKRLERQVGGHVSLSADPSLAMSAGHVH